jgi:hypothetical protein
MCDAGEPPLDKSKECRKFHFQKVEKRSEDADRLGVPLMFTEFGACFDGQECATEITNSADAFDSQLASWSYWMYKSFSDFTTTGGTREGMFNSDGTPQDLKLKAIARTYAHAFQGTPSQMYFSTTDGSFYTEWEVDAAITEPTEIYMNKAIWYSQGFKAVASDATSASDKVTWETKDGENYMQVVYDADYLQSVDGQKARVLLTPSIPAEEMTGIVQEEGTIVDWSIEDAGNTSQCSFNF